MRILIVIVFAAVSSLMVFQPIKAQTQDTLVLEQVEVTASVKTSKTERLQQSIDLDIIASNQTHSMALLLQQNSQVFIKDYGPGSIATASFRGTTASHTQVLWNGVAINSPNQGQVDFNRLPVFFVDEAQLAYGARAAEQQGGFGGVVAINNKPQFNKGFILAAKQAIGSFNSFGSYLDISWSNAKVNIRTRIFRASSTNDFEYLNTAPIEARKMKQQDADFLDRGFLQELNWQIGNGMLSFASWNQWNDRNLPAIMTNIERGGNPEERQDDRFHRSILKYKYYWNKASLEVKTAFFNERQYYFLRTTSNYNDFATVSLIDSRNEINYLENSLVFTQKIGQHWQLLSTVNISRQSVFSTNYEDEKLRNQLSVRLDAIYTSEKGNSLQIGAHQDDVDGNSMIFSPHIIYSGLLQFVDGLKFTTGISRNFRLPGLNDLYWYPGGNADLKAEQASQIDFALQFERHWSSTSVAINGGIFASDINDWIQWRPTAYRYWIPENISHVFARGAEISLTGKMVSGGFSHQLHFNYAYTRTTDESRVAQLENSQGRQLIYIPVHHANMMYKISFKNWDFQYILAFTGARNTSLNQEEFYGFKLPAYTLHHFAVSKNWRNFDVEMRINNLLDKDYQAIKWRAMPGRNFAVALSYQFKNQ